MAIQKEVQLDQPIDHTAPPTIYGTKLIPSYSNAALNLTVDFIRQKQSQANQQIIRHPYTILVVLSGILSFGYYKLGWMYFVGGWRMVKANKDELITILVFVAMFSSLLFTILTKSTDFIKETSEKIVDENKEIFGVDLKEFASLNINKNDKKTKELLSKGENTQIIVYRETPIAVLSLVTKPELSNDEKFVTKITGCGVRKVYYKSGILEDLIDWAIIRSNTLNKNKASKIIVLIDVMSTDYDLKKKLKLKQFKFLEKSYYNDSKILKIFGINNEVWGLNLNVTKLDNEIETIKSSEGSTGVKK
ncbi:Inorganic phosphate transporter [Wickerhamomyces ciferrii]|uniref:Inorganic phosphate transporter n=1 Tax=Wickerhamomyces ciferrii (strain ATCC 14091 / BCRC 22168 / CBS 111 / JCM 3599 / NBRC 0793 / NRRL Y-1031 F-60-10) TaxID=1206466 RepID=K0KT43_WICCF|nr:Inorganic phosphate transporter [Wickerhamomyces ciferrii]CCH45207.1 Inorganic phosphate transporter [Wickerhamomyces ciferrii]